MSDTPRTDACKTVDSWNLCRELERENATLREKDEDWENAVLHARDHRCDEAHCTCVVPLLGKINQLERENAALREDKERLDSRTILLTENGERVHHVEVNLRAAIDAAREEAQP